MKRIPQPHRSGQPRVSVTCPRFFLAEAPFMGAFYFYERLFLASFGTLCSCLGFLFKSTPILKILKAIRCGVFLVDPVLFWDPRDKPLVPRDTMRGRIYRSVEKR